MKYVCVCKCAMCVCVCRYLRNVPIYWSCVENSKDQIQVSIENMTYVYWIPVTSTVRKQTSSHLQTISLIYREAGVKRTPQYIGTF